MAAPEVWRGFLDVTRDASDGARAAGAAYAGTRVVADTDLPTTEPGGLPVRLELTGGAGQLAGPAALARRRGLDVAVLEVALRDLDDPVGGVRRVLAAVDDARDTDRLDHATEVHVVVPGPPSGRWLDVADEVASADLRLVVVLDAGGDDVPGWIDAALDRETPFSLRGGDAAAAVAVLGTTATLWEPGASPTDPAALAAARRWCRSWRCDDVAAATAHLDAIT